MSTIKPDTTPGSTLLNSFLKKCQHFNDSIELNPEQLHIKVENSIWWNNASYSRCSVAQGWRNNEFSATTYFHAGHSLIPSFDHLALANNKRKGLVSIPGAVKFLATC
mmetsp:Transcript_17687/g.29089  ORF Transcript_17687/g.29089 Transcript_17687/m.29089 type:complete len:108 (-) Transcript_17687:185-508(-)